MHGLVILGGTAKVSRVSSKYSLVAMDKHVGLTPRHYCMPCLQRALTCHTLCACVPRNHICNANGDKDCLKHQRSSEVRRYSRADSQSTTRPSKTCQAGFDSKDQPKLVGMRSFSSASVDRASWSVLCVYAYAKHANELRFLIQRMDQCPGHLLFCSAVEDPSACCQAACLSNCRDSYASLLRAQFCKGCRDNTP